MPARESIERLPAEIDSLPEIGSTEDMAMRPMQAEGRALNGALIHLSRGRIDTVFQSAICSQQVARLMYAGFAALKEIARYAWANEDKTMRYCGPKCKSLVVNPRLEPIRPYEESGEVEYGLYLIGDGAQGQPFSNVPNSKHMAAFAVMFGGAAVAWKCYRVHTCVTDSTSLETLVASRLVARGASLRGLAQFIWVPQVKPTALFTDNDGTWYVSRDAMSTSAMTYIMRHVRFLQQAVYDDVVKVFQVDGELNPTDALTKYLPKPAWQRHLAFLMGYPEVALQLWRQDKKYESHRYKKIVPVSPLEQ